MLKKKKKHLKKKFWMAVWLPLSASKEAEGLEKGSAELETWGRE